MQSSQQKMIQIYLRTFDKKARRCSINSLTDSENICNLIQRRIRYQKQKIIVYYKGKMIINNDQRQSIQPSDQQIYLEDKQILHVLSIQNICKPRIQIDFKQSFKFKQKKQFKHFNVVCDRNTQIGEFYQKQFKNLVYQNQEDSSQTIKMGVIVQLVGNPVFIYTGRILKYTKSFYQQFVEDQSQIICLFPKEFDKQSIFNKKILNYQQKSQILRQQKFESQSQQPFSPATTQLQKVKNSQAQIAKKEQFTLHQKQISVDCQNKLKEQIDVPPSLPLDVPLAQNQDAPLKLKQVQSSVNNSQRDICQGQYQEQQFTVNMNKIKYDTNYNSVNKLHQNLFNQKPEQQQNLNQQKVVIQQKVNNQYQYLNSQNVANQQKATSQYIKTNSEQQGALCSVQNFVKDQNSNIQQNFSIQQNKQQNIQPQFDGQIYKKQIFQLNLNNQIKEKTQQSFSLNGQLQSFKNLNDTHIQQKLNKKGLISSKNQDQNQDNEIIPQQNQIQVKQNSQNEQIADISQQQFQNNSLSFQKRSTEVQMQTMASEKFKQLQNERHYSEYSKFNQQQEQKLLRKQQRQIQQTFQEKHQDKFSEELQQYENQMRTQSDFSNQQMEPEEYITQTKFVQGDLLYTAEIDMKPKLPLLDLLAYEYHDLLCKNLQQFVQEFGNISINYEEANQFRL